MIYTIYTDGVSLDKKGLCGSAYMIYNDYNRFVCSGVNAFKSDMIVEAETLAIVQSIKRVITDCDNVNSIILYTDSKCAKTLVSKYLTTGKRNIPNESTHKVFYKSIFKDLQMIKESDVDISIRKVLAHTGVLNRNNAVDRYIRFTIPLLAAEDIVTL